MRRLGIVRRPRRYAAVSVALASVLLAACGSGHGAPPLSYVSLGDSFSAGQGLPGGVQPCGRAPGAYPELVAAEAKASGSFQACNGASTADVLSGQVEPLTSATDVVTVTIGGNDIGFAPVMTRCVLELPPCTRYAGEVDAKLATLPAALAGVYGEVRRRAPKATLLVVGYPQLVADPATLAGPTCAGLTLDEVAFVRAEDGKLNGVVKAATEAAGGRYLDASAAFAGHEACTADPWMTGVSLSDVSASFHPNAAGQAELARLVEAALPRRQ